MFVRPVRWLRVIPELIQASGVGVQWGLAPMLAVDAGQHAQ